MHLNRKSNVPKNNEMSIIQLQNNTKYTVVSRNGLKLTKISLPQQISPEEPS